MIKTPTRIGGEHPMPKTSAAKPSPAEQESFKNLLDGAIGSTKSEGAGHPESGKQTVQTEKKQASGEVDLATQATAAAMGVQPQAEPETPVAKEAEQPVQAGTAAVSSEGETLYTAATPQVQAEPLVQAATAPILPAMASSVEPEAAQPASPPVTGEAAVATKATDVVDATEPQAAQETTATTVTTTSAPPVQIPAGDIVKTQVTTSQQGSAPVADVRTPTQINWPDQAAASQQKFDTMVNQAQQQLGQMQQTTGEAVDTAELPITDTPPATLEHQTPTATLPSGNDFSSELAPDLEQLPPATPLELDQGPVRAQPNSDRMQQGQTPAPSTPAPVIPAQAPTPEPKATAEQPQMQRTPVQAREAREPQAIPQRSAENRSVNQAESQPQPQTDAVSQEIRQTQPLQQAAQPQEIQRPTVEPEQIRRIQEQIQHNLQQDRTEFEMQLNPQELGKINIKLVLEGGRLAVEIMAQSSRTAEMLSRGGEGLFQSLKLNHLNLDSVQVVNAPQNMGNHMDSAFNMLSGGGDQWNQNAGASQGARNASYSREQRTETAEEAQRAPEAEPQSLLNYAV